MQKQLYGALATYIIALLGRKAKWELLLEVTRLHIQ